jgi:hypothetical protein
MPVATVFKNLDAGSSMEEMIEQFHVTREKIQGVLELAARSLDAPSVPTTTSWPVGAANSPVSTRSSADAHSL